MTSMLMKGSTQKRQRKRGGQMGRGGAENRRGHWCGGCAIGGVVGGGGTNTTVPTAAMTMTSDFSNQVRAN